MKKIFYKDGQWMGFDVRIGGPRSIEREYTYAREHALPILNPEIIGHIDSKNIKDGVDYVWAGLMTVKMSEGWTPSYRDPDNSGGHQPSEPVGYVLSCDPLFEPQGSADHGDRLPAKRKITELPLEIPSEDVLFFFRGKPVPDPRLEVLTVIENLMKENEKLKQVLREIIPLAEDGHVLHKRNGSHQEFLSEDVERLDKARKLMES